MIYSGETDVHIFPDDGWKTFIGDDESNTDVLGRYKVLVLGFSLTCGRCSISVDVDFEPFFVIPEFMLGTMGSVIASLSGLGFILKKKENVRMSARAANQDRS